MRYEDYLKLEMVSEKISTKDIAHVLGIEPQSFRNKLNRQNFGIRDVIISAQMFDQSLVLLDQDGNPAYTFDPSDYLSEEDNERLEQYQETGKLDFGEWVKTLSSNQKAMIFNSIKRTNHEMLFRFMQKNEEGSATLDSYNFTHVIEIYGKNCQFAKNWLFEKIRGATPEDEITFYVAAEVMFNVYIHFDSPVAIGVSTNEDENIILDFVDVRDVFPE